MLSKSAKSIFTIFANLLVLAPKHVVSWHECSTVVEQHDCGQDCRSTCPPDRLSAVVPSHNLPGCERQKDFALLLRSYTPYKHLIGLKLFRKKIICTIGYCSLRSFTMSNQSLPLIRLSTYQSIYSFIFSNNLFYRKTGLKRVGSKYDG